MNGEDWYLRVKRGHRDPFMMLTRVMVFIMYAVMLRRLIIVEKMIVG